MDVPFSVEIQIKWEGRGGEGRSLTWILSSQVGGTTEETSSTDALEVVVVGIECVGSM